MRVLMFDRNGNVVPETSKEKVVSFFAVEVENGEVHAYKMEGEPVLCSFKEWPKVAVQTLMKLWNIRGIDG